MRRLLRNELFWLALIVLVAAFLRLYRLHEVPSGLYGDEAFKGVEAQRLLRGGYLPIFFEGNYGEEPLYTYLVALSFLLFGASGWAIRLVAATAGLATIPLIYLLARELFPPEEGQPSLVGLLAAFWLATSYWHITYSRFGIEPVLLPLFITLASYFLWRGLRSKRRWPFIWSGLFLGTSLYTYQAARLWPFVILSFLGGLFLIDRHFRQIHLTNTLALLTVSFLVFMPLGLFGLAHPDVYFARARGVSILNPKYGQVLQTFPNSVVKTTAMFTFWGDPILAHNPASRPILDPWTAICFLVGLLVSLKRWKRPSYLFVLLWFAIMLLPTILTGVDLPHFSRAIGILPVVCIFPALGVEATWLWLNRSGVPRTLNYLFWSGVLCLLAFTTFLNCRDYFVPWRQRPELRRGLDGIFVDTAQLMNTRTVLEAVWVLPVTPVAEADYRQDTIDFLYQGPTAYYFLLLDEATAPSELTRICKGKRRALLIDWQDHTLEEAYLAAFGDPKGLLSFLFHKYGRELKMETFEGFDLVTFELPPSPDFAIARSFEPLSINFGNEVELTGASYGGSSLYETSTSSEVEEKVLPSGKSGWVVLRWKGLRAMTKDYKVGLYLTDAMGRLVGQMDKLLLSNYLRPTSHWEPGQVEIDYYTLPSLPATPPGEYYIEVAVYDEETLSRLPIVGRVSRMQTAEVGTLQVVEPLLPPLVEPQVKLEVEIAPRVRLLGYDLPGEKVEPGEEIPLTLYWEALEDVGSDYLLSLQLRDGEGKVWGEEVGRPVDGRYPTLEWEKGEVIRDWHKMGVEAGASEGAYTLFLKVMERGRVIGETALATIRVEGRPYQFAIPPIQYPLQARVGEDIEFLGYDLSSREVKAGGVLDLTLYWQALGGMERSYTVFVHLLDERSQIWGQKDTIPGGGSMPTTGWVEGEVITDRYEVMVMPGAPAGHYLLECGLYWAETGERLPVFDMEGESLGDRLLLPIEIGVTP
jgi:4-amino-4-deoxy-L-arabinose transferase-like glycosyltransferase